MTTSSKTSNAPDPVVLLSDGRILLCDRDPKWSRVSSSGWQRPECVCRPDAALRAELQRVR